MSNDKNEITPEKLEQIKQLQQMLMQQQAGALGQAAQLAKPSKWTVKGIFLAVIQSMSNAVKFIDQLIYLVVKPNSDNVNDVVKSARSPILFGLFVMVFFVFFAGIWASIAPLDSAAVAIGTVVSSTQKKVINHQEGGIIKNIYVKVGDKVKKGERLIELDDSRLKSEYENTLNQYRTFLASESRLLAEINHYDKIEYPEFITKDQSVSDVTKIIETQDNLFSSKNKVMDAERGSMKQKVHQLNKQIEGLNAKKEALIKNLEATVDRLDATKKLNEKGFAQKSALLELQSREASLKSEIAITDTEVTKTEQEITKTDIELLNFESKFTTQTLTELKEAQSQLSTNRERYNYLQEAITRVIIKSPVDGTINNINFHTVGSTIPAGQPIIEISPTDDKLVIEAKVEPKQIDSIKEGLVAKIRFSAFKSRTTPLFLGKVISVSPDIIMDHQRMGGDPLAGGYYLARIELDASNFKELAEPRKLVLHPGMQAEVQLITGTRTLLRYLLDPVIDAMFKGFKEK